MKKIILSLLILSLQACSFSKTIYPQISPKKLVILPRDNYAHPEFRTEWWYYNGSLQTKSGKEFSFHLVFFVRRTDDDYVNWIIPARTFSNPVHLAHFSLTDLKTGRVYFYEKRTEDHITEGGEAGALEDRFHVWNEEWFAKLEDGKHLLNATGEEVQLSLNLAPKSLPLIHGESGVFTKGEGRGSYYITHPRLEGGGSLKLGGEELQISKAEAWLDHEYGSFHLGTNIEGWDWFSINLSDGSDLMLYILREEGGKISKFSKGTYRSSSGEVRKLFRDSINIIPTRFWHSPDTGAKYPVDWHISLTELGLDIAVKSKLDQSEIDSAGSTRVNYWEGSISAKGKKDSKPIEGRGFMELTGYAHPLEQLRE